MNDEERFEEIDAAIKLKLAELREYVEDVDSSSLSSSSKEGAQQCLKEVDQQVPLLITSIDKQIKAAEDLLSDIPTSQRSKYTRRIQVHKTERNRLSRSLVVPSHGHCLLKTSASDPSKVLDGQDIQRDRLLKSTARLESSSRRLDHSRQVALETESFGVGILADLKGQRQQLENTRAKLEEADGYINKSLKTLKEMGRRYILLFDLNDFLDGFEFGDVWSHLFDYTS
jgi:vesicle transport through interaction with t-SNAREs 1